MSKDQSQYKQIFVGGIWKKDGYMSGSIDLAKAGVGEGKINFIVVDNQSKQRDTHPDLSIKMKNPNFSGEEQAPAAAAQEPADEADLPF